MSPANNPAPRKKSGKGKSRSVDSELKYPVREEKIHWRGKPESGTYDPPLPYRIKRTPSQ